MQTEDFESDQVLADETAIAAEMSRKPLVPPAHIPENMSLFDYLSNCRPPVHKKIADITCSQQRLPPDLREDAAQEIFAVWATMRPDTQKYRPGQIASYAHRMAGHACLRLRRELGSAVRLPGSAFRKRRDGSTYVTPGVLATAMDWNELEGFLNTDGIEESAYSPDSENAVAVLRDEPVSDDSEEQVAAGRMAQLQAIRHLIEAEAFRVMERLIHGFTHDDIQAELGIKRGVIMRHVSNVTTQLNRV